MFNIEEYETIRPKSDRFWGKSETIERPAEGDERSYAKAFKHTVNYGLHQMGGNRLPHVSVTMDTYRQARNERWEEDSFGCQHEAVALIFPHVKPLIKWHLCDANGVPMHYVANGMFWWEYATGRRVPGEYDRKDQDYVQSFKDTVLYGTLPFYDLAFDPLAFSLKDIEGKLRYMPGSLADKQERAVVEHWLKQREPHFNRELWAVLTDLGISLTDECIIRRY
jgi:hypothetical protein